MTLDQVKALVEEKGVEYFLCSFVEMSGVPKAKVVPVTNIDDMAAEGAGFAGSQQAKWDKVRRTRTWQTYPTSVL